ncbi:P-loop containing nucleoside triphosphate hydrolase protein [Phlyctochytrium arcticum]|nr:P-loop containing nucleoside triphosphate hydrolase protein [Phlyctochytrium arcticum]
MGHWEGQNSFADEEHSGYHEDEYQARDTNHNRNKRKHYGEELPASTEVNTSKERYAKKKRRGGKQARDKELSWKASNGLIEGNPSGTHVSPEQPVLEKKEGKATADKADEDAKLKLELKKNGLPLWISNPLTISADVTRTAASNIDNPLWGLSQTLKSQLQTLGIEYLFPVQMSVLPVLLTTRHSSAIIPPGDLCVSAPTGSGKTLAFAIPIVETLLNRIIPRLRALIVLPTRDLALQVKSTFDSLTRGTDIRCVLITGQTSFTVEQSQLVSYDDSNTAMDSGVSSKVDILIATPGRLIDHLRGTKGFTLQHLRFLVIDEADRLLNQNYQDWLKHVLNAASGLPMDTSTPMENTAASTVAPIGATGSAISLRPPLMDPNHDLSTLQHYTPLQKLLFSATLTRNPAKINTLRLCKPTYIAVTREGTGEAVDADDTLESRYIAPATLTENMIVCSEAERKPLMLLHLLTQENLKGVLVFTKSVEAAHRLSMLLQHFAGYQQSRDPRARRKKKKQKMKSDDPDPSIAQAFSSDTPTCERKRILSLFISGETRCLVCSDGMARGMDLESSVACVINYDAPSRLKSYIHRIGRTARAGRDGVAYTILEEKEARWFKQESSKIGRAGDKKVNKIRVKDEDIEPLIPAYKHALQKLADMVKGNRPPPTSTDDQTLDDQTFDDQSLQ